MNCIKCGTPLKPNDKFCVNCGLVVGTKIPALEKNDSIVDADIQNNNSSEVINEKKNNIEVNKEVTSETFEEKKSIGKLKYFAIIILALALIIASIVFGLSLLQKDETNNSVEEAKTITIKETYYKVRHNNYNFYLDDDLLFIDTDSGLVIGNDSFKIVLEVGEGSFDKINNNRSLMQEEFNGKKYSASVAETRVVDEVNFVTVEASKENINGVISYAKIDDTHYLVATIYSVNNEFVYEPLKYVSSIIKRIEFDDENQTIPNLNTFKTIGAINVGLSLQKDYDDITE